MDPVTALAQNVQHVNNVWGLTALVFTGVIILISAWITKLSSDSKKLVAEKEKAEIERANARATERTAQIAGVESRLESEITRVENTLGSKIKDEVIELNKSIIAISKQVEKSQYVADGVGGSLDRHKAAHEKNDFEIKSDIKQIKDRLGQIETNSIDKKQFDVLSEKVHGISENVVELKTIIVERFNRAPA